MTTVSRELALLASSKCKKWIRVPEKSSQPKIESAHSTMALAIDIYDQNFLIPTTRIVAGK